MPTDGYSKEEKKEFEPQRIDHKEDAIEQCNPYQRYGDDLGTEGYGLIFAKTTNIRS